VKADKRRSSRERIDSSAASPAVSPAVETPLRTLEVRKFNATEGPLPLYQVVMRYILKRLESGEWLPDTRIPSENELVELLGISRMTVNRALRELTGGGRLFRIQGVGTFVASRKALTPLLEVRPITEDIRLRGGAHSSRVYRLTQEVISEQLAADMEMPVGSIVYHSVLVHTEKDIPVQLEDRFVNPAVARGYLDQDFTQITPSKYLFQVAALTEVEHMVEAILPDAKTRRLLKIGGDEPCLMLKRRTWTHGVVVTKSIFIYPGSRYQLGSRFKTSAGAQILPA
jgi:GntR family transcriptional regulator, histidine utilization repressor